MTTATSTATTAAGIPRGRYIASLHMFQIIHSKGKTFSNGGIGIALPKEVHAKQQQQQQQQHYNVGEEEHILVPSLNLYLWVEEALYLHDAGLADFVRDDGESAKQQDQSNEGNNNSNNNNSNDKIDDDNDDDQVILTTRELFDIMLSTTAASTTNISLPMYRVYAHLKQQSFRVLRYVPQPPVQQKQQKQQHQHTGITNAVADQHHQEDEEGTSSTTTTDKMHPSSSRCWRHNMSQAPPPQIWRQEESMVSNANNNCNNAASILAWQAYDPNANFRKTNPGRPSFYVAVCLYSEPSPNATEFYKLLLLTAEQHEDIADIPIKVAAVADSGTVILFGFTNFGVPSIMAAAPPVARSVSYK